MERTKVRGSLRRKNRKLGLNAFISFLLLAYILPLYYVVNNAFKDSTFISRQPFHITPESFSTDNLVDAFNRMDYLNSLSNSAIVLVMTMVILVISGSLAGFGITYAKNKTLNTVYLTYIALISMPLQIAMIPLMVLMRDLNLGNTHLGMALIYTAIYMPFVVFLYTGFMRSIPRDLIEAAKIDGCSPVGIYIKIYMPLLTTITGMVIILRGVSTWNDLFVPIIVVSRAHMYTLTQQLFIFSASRVGQWDLLFAGTFLSMVPLMILFLAMQKTFIKGIMSGSIKG